MNSGWLWDMKISDEKVRQILRHPEGKRFIHFASLLLRRKNEPREVFSRYLDKEVFCKNWPAIKRMMRRDDWNSTRIIFWQAVYEELVKLYKEKGIVFREKISFTKNPLYADTGKMLREARKEAGLSQEELAKKIKVSQQVISRVEKGGENVSLGTIDIIAKALGKRVEFRLV